MWFPRTAPPARRGTNPERDEKFESGFLPIEGRFNAQRSERTLNSNHLPPMVCDRTTVAPSRAARPVETASPRRHSARRAELRSGIQSRYGTLLPGAEGGEAYGRMRGLFQRAGNPRMAGCLSFAARRGGRPKRGGSGGIIGGRTVIDVRGGVNASARCLNCGRSRIALSDGISNARLVLSEPRDDCRAPPHPTTGATHFRFVRPVRGSSDAKQASARMSPCAAEQIEGD